MTIPEKVARWRPQVDKWCVQLKVSQALVMAVIQMESGGNPSAKRHEPAFEKNYIRSSAVWLNRCKELGMTTAEVATSYGLQGAGWIHAKIALVFLLSGYQGWMVALSRKMARGERPVAERTLRMVNEVPALFTILLVGLAVLKPF